MKDYYLRYKKQEDKFLNKEFKKQKKYIKPVQYYLDNAEGTYNGYCFKDEQAFKTGKGICYISEYGLQELASGNSTLLEVMETKATIKRDIKLYGNRKMKAEDIFETIDWQSPASLIYEYEY